MTAASTQAPLGGIMVVDFTHLVAGPFCTMLLADAGADVVKIEPPWGDHSRMRGPTRQEGEVSVSSYLAAGNRGKRSLALNLKTQGGHSAAEETAGTSRHRYRELRAGSDLENGLRLRRVARPAT